MGVSIARDGGVGWGSGWLGEGTLPSGGGPVLARNYSYSYSYGTHFSVVVAAIPPRTSHLLAHKKHIHKKKHSSLEERSKHTSGCCCCHYYPMIKNTWVIQLTRQVKHTLGCGCHRYPLMDRKHIHKKEKLELHKKKRRGRNPDSEFLYFLCVFCAS